MEARHERHKLHGIHAPMASQAAPSDLNGPEDVVVAEDVGAKRLVIALAVLLEDR